jgi:O-antigen/teichoic acid export membrane protein
MRWRVPALLVVARRYADFAIFRTPQNLLSALTGALPMILFAQYFSLDVAGQYALALTILAAPIRLVSSSFGTVYYPYISAKIHQGGATHAIAKGTMALALLGSVPAIAIFTFGPQFFALLFGDEWIMAGEIATWLAIAGLVQLANQPSVAAVPALQAQGGLLIYEVLSSTIKISSLFIYISFGKDPILAIMLMSAISVTSYIILISWILKRSFDHENAIGSGV